MICLLYRSMILPLVIFALSGCMSNAERVRYFKDQEQARLDKLEVQAHKNQKAAQDKAYASNAEELIRTCANTSEATIRNDVKLLAQCRSINLIPGKWKGDFELSGNKFTIELNITDLNGSGVAKDVPTPYLIFPTKVDVVSQDSSNDFNRQIVKLLSGNYSVTYFADARFLRLNIDDDHVSSSKTYIGALDMGLARLDSDNFFDGKCESSWRV